MCSWFTVRGLAAFWDLAGFLPIRVGGRLYRFAWERYVRNDTTVPNFPGPPVPVYLLDYPTDAGIPDNDILADAIRASLDEYVTLAARHTAIKTNPAARILTQTVIDTHLANTR